MQLTRAADYAVRVMIHLAGMPLRVMEDIEGPLRLNVCLTSDASCGRQGWCPAHPVWIRAQQAMADVLANSSVEELFHEALANRWN